MKVRTLEHFLEISFHQTSINLLKSSHNSQTSSNLSILLYSLSLVEIRISEWSDVIHGTASTSVKGKAWSHMVDIRKRSSLAKVRQLCILDHVKIWLPIDKSINFSLFKKLVNTIVNLLLQLLPFSFLLTTSS